METREEGEWVGDGERWIGLSVWRRQRRRGETGRQSASL